MICPKCGSANVQFSTKVSGHGYSGADGCCGFLIFGPLGLLCGSCGSGIKTEEFWICNECGNKFSNSAGRKAVARQAEIEQTCKRYKQELGSQPLEHYILKHQTANDELEKVLEEYNSKFNELVNKYSSVNETVNRYRKKRAKENNPGFLYRSVGIIALLIAFVSLICGLWPISIASIVLIGVMEAVSQHQLKKLKQKVRDILLESESSFRPYFERLKQALDNEEHCKTYADKARYIKDYDKTNSTQNIC